ncbi:hypothetical protein K438DRAFT_509868 [Mycena galopus ATCC 62051]|nr:hypothetical protein K438DRAFT_509868 [Mycena galopus ATCC 62051]
MRTLHLQAFCPPAELSAPPSPPSSLSMPPGDSTLPGHLSGVHFRQFRWHTEPKASHSRLSPALGRASGRTSPINGGRSPQRHVHLSALCFVISQLAPLASPRTRDRLGRRICHPSLHLKDCSDCRALVTPPLPENAPPENETWCPPLSPADTTTDSHRYPEPSPAPGRPSHTATLSPPLLSRPEQRRMYRMTSPSSHPEPSGYVTRTVSGRLCAEQRAVAARPLKRHNGVSLLSHPFSPEHLRRTKSRSREALSSGTTASPLLFAIIVRSLQRHRRRTKSSSREGKRRDSVAPPVCHHHTRSKTSTGCTSARVDPLRWTSSCASSGICGERRR